MPVAIAGLTHRADAHAGGVPERQVLWLIAVAGAATATTAVVLALGSDHLSNAGIQGALTAWIVLAYVFAGLVAWERRPTNRLGPLMITAGFVMFLQSLSAANAALPFTVGIALDLAASVVFLHVFLAFPSGRLHGRLEVGLVALGYFTALGLQLVGLVLGNFGPDNLLTVFDEVGAAQKLLNVQLFVLSAIALAGVGILLVRARHRAAPLRRSLALLADSFAVALVLLAFLYTSAALGLASGQPLFEAIRRTTLFAFGL